MLHRMLHAPIYLRSLKKISFEIVRQGADSYKVTVLPQTGAPCMWLGVVDILETGPFSQQALLIRTYRH
jgi:hypothetical protein